MSRTARRNLSMVIFLALACSLAFVCFLLVSCAVSYETKAGDKFRFEVTDGKSVQRILDQRR